MSQDRNNILKESIEEYQFKMQEIAQNQQFIPIRLFQQAERLIRNDIVSAIKSKQTSQIVEQTLLQWRNELYSRNQAAIAKWCNQILLQSTNIVDKKIGRQIKSFTTYRQQISMTIQFLKRKIDSYITSQLAIIIQDFFIQKILENCLQLNNLSLNQVQQQLKMLQIENKSLLVQAKQYKRRNNKQQSQNHRILLQLRQSYSILQTKCSLLQENNDQLKQQLKLCEQNKQQIINKKTQQNNLQLNFLRQKVESLKQGLEQIGKKNTFLDMQLQKQQLLHKQTMMHYQQLVSSYHSKEQQLKQQILQVSRVSQKQIDQYKILSSRKIQDYQNTTIQLQQQLYQFQTLLKGKQNQLLLAREQLIAQKNRSRIQISNYSNQIMQLELKNKILEDKQNQCDILKNKILKLQNQNKKNQKERQQLQQKYKEIEKQKLVAEQKFQYLKQQYQQQHAKNAILSQQLFNKQTVPPSSYRSTSYKIDSFCQTDPTQHQQKLKTALILIKQMERDYLKLKYEEQKRRKRLK